MSDYRVCENCGRETFHARRDFGYGWTELGSWGQDHSLIVYECQECGAINDE